MGNGWKGEKTVTKATKAMNDEWNKVKINGHDKV